MPYSHSWLIPEHVVYEKQWGHVTSEDFMACMDDVYAFISQSSQPKVHVLSNGLEVIRADIGLKEIQSVTKKVHPQLGYSLLVRSGSPIILPITNLLTSVLQHLSHIQLKMFDTDANALLFLKENFPDLASAVDDYLAKED